LSRIINLPARRRLRLALAAVALASLAAGCGDRSTGPPGGPGGGGQPGRGPGAGQAVAVIATRVAAQEFIDRFTALGTARANESIRITSRTSSIVTRINFREGQRVNPGDLLVELDTRQELADLDLAKAQLAQAESQFNRSKALAATQAVSAADLDQLEANLLVARAQVRGAQARLDTLYVRAPFAGTVGLRKVSLGDLVGPDTQITTLDDTSTIKLDFGVPETFISEISKGMTVVGTSAVYPDRRFTGQVTSIDSRLDPVTRSVTVVASVPNPDDDLKPGMFLSIGLEKRRENVLLIPEEALVPREGRQFVFVVADGKAVEQEVALGGRKPGLAEVRSGLTAGDLIVVEGTQRLRDGIAVQVAPNS
jgi:membrane fusion protein (multidrug efflux system)